MATTPLTASRYPISSDSANIAQYFANLALDLDDNAIPRFTTTTARDSAYSSWVTLGGTMDNGMRCSVNGVPYRRINGTWRVDQTRVFTRGVTGLGTGFLVTSGGSAEAGVTSGIGMTPTGTTFTMYEAGNVGLSASLRAGPNPANTAVAAQCSLKVDGSAVGNIAISRLDQTVSINAMVALAAGAHTVTLRVDAVGGAVSWVDGIVLLTLGTAE
jgi:hypothetical protein